MWASASLQAQLPAKAFDTQNQSAQYYSHRSKIAFSCTNTSIWLINANKSPNLDIKSCHHLQNLGQITKSWSCNSSWPIYRLPTTPSRQLLPDHGSLGPASKILGLKPNGGSSGVTNISLAKGDAKEYEEHTGRRTNIKHKKLSSVTIVIGYRCFQK